MVGEIKSSLNSIIKLRGARSDVLGMSHIALYNADVIGKVLSKISAFGSFIAKATAILGAFIVGFKIFQGIFKGFDRDLAKDLFSAFKWLADKIIWVGNWIAKSFEAFSQAAETSILFFKNKLGILSDAEYNKRTTDIWLGKPGEGKERYNFTKSIGTTSFAGLNRAAQDMSLNREAIKLAQSQLDQLKVIAENTKTKVPFKGSDNTGAIMINNAVSAFSEMPWLQKASMLTMLIP
jgi:hypothetical protein